MENLLSRVVARWEWRQSGVFSLPAPPEAAGEEGLEESPSCRYLLLPHGIAILCCSRWSLLLAVFKKLLVFPDIFIIGY